ncbi:MAG: lipase, partial [Gammaproteobacteria bacterium]
MKLRLLLPLLLALTPLAFADPHPGDGGGARNKDGSIVTGVLTARFDPNAGLEGVPIPSNLFFLGTTDLTLNAPTEGLDPSAAGLVAQINSLDGFSLTERWTTTFVDDNGNPGSIDPTSVVPGQSVRVFQVTTERFVAVTSIVRELTPGLDYTAVASGNVVAIVPLQPLGEYSSYMAVLTNDIRDTFGNDATPDQTYFLTKRQEPWVDENGRSTYPLIDDATAQGLALLQPLTLSMEAAAAGAGIDPADIILSWTVQTQSVTPTLGLLRSIAEPAPVQTAPTGLNTSIIGGFGVADIHIGVITLPYYLSLPTAENPTAPLNTPWQAEPGAYVPPFDALGLDPTSTNLTLANPFPVVKDVQTVPVFVTVPNAASGASKPAGGWPVVIYGHGLGSNRVSILAMADALAAAGFVGVAIDFPLHGVEPWNPLFAPFNIENTPFAPLGNERHLDLDYVNNATGAPGPDGIVDPSGTHALNFQDFRISRDNLRQGIADLSILAVSLGNFDLDSDGVPDLRPFDVGYAGISWGGINGTGFSAVEPLVTRTFLSVPAGGLVRGGEASPTFGPDIRAGLAAIGIMPG